MACSKDMTNAFACGDWREHDETLRQHARGQDLRLAVQRYRHSVVKLQCEDGVLHMKTGEGGTMGDPFVVQLFKGTFRKCVDAWQRRLDKSDDTEGSLVAKWKWMRADLSLYKYADDLLKLILAKRGERMGGFLRRVRMSDEMLDLSIEPVGFEQNKGKQEFVVQVPGEGSEACSKWIRQHFQGITGGVMLDSMRYLGPKVSIPHRAAEELDRRVEAATEAFYSLGGFWCLSLPYRWTRTILLAFVSNAL